MHPRIGLIIAFLVVLVLFLVQNSGPIPLRFLFWEQDISGSLFILVSALVSFLVGFFFGRFSDDLKERREKREEREQLAANRPSTE